MSWGPLIVDGVECTLHAYNEITRLNREGKTDEARKIWESQLCAKTEEAEKIERKRRREAGEDRPPPVPGLNRHQRRRLAAKSR